MSVGQDTAMADPKHAPTDPAPLYFYTPGGIEWETPRPRPAKPSLLHRILSRAPSSGPSRHVPTTSTVPADKPEPTGPLAAHATSPSVLDRILPPHRTYLSLSRRVFLALLALLLLAILALILGLSIGLTRRHHSQALPLPSSSAVHTGDLTYYAPGLGACGLTSSADDAIAAVSHLVFDAAGGGGSNPNANPVCGKKIRVERDQGGGKGNKSVDVVVVDRCVGCAATDLDLSPSVFAVLADQALGRVVGSWAWLGDGDGS